MLIKQPNGRNNKNHSFELRGSRMYTNCDCWRRNGLQDNCPRSMCQGKSGCMNSPNPNCGPSSYPMKFANMTMGAKGYMSSGLDKHNDFSGMGSMDPIGSPITSYPEFQNDMSMQSPAGMDTFPSSTPMNGIPDGNAWSANNQQSTYPY